ncbi:MAG: hypothetical protein II192_01930 [Clostridia bacterium]|nr:hypothetical protein [Clostridia bacterium]
MTKANSVRTVISCLLSLILSAALLASALFLSVRLTVCRYPYMRAAMEALEVPEKKLADFRAELKEEMLNSGVDDAFIDSILPRDLAGDFFASVREIYGEEATGDSLSDGSYRALVRRAVEEKIKEQIAALGADDGESLYDEETLVAVTDTIVRLYQSYLKFPGASMLAHYMERVDFLAAVMLAVSVLIAGTAFLILLGAGKKEGIAFRYASVAAFAAALIFFVCFLFFRFSGYIEGFYTALESDHAILLSVRKAATDITGWSAAALGALGLIFLGIRLLCLRPSDRIGEGAERLYEMRDSTSRPRRGVRSSRR